MKPSLTARHRGFTLLETVIAIGVLAVLLTGFMVVFTPAAEGIRKSINVQQADRLASTLEQELVTIRAGQSTADIKTGFDKAFYRIMKSTGPNQSGRDSGPPDDALLVYQYRGSLTDKRNPDDGTLKPLPSITGKLPGKDYATQTIVRTRSDPKLLDDLAAVEGAIYLVKCVQLVFENGELQLIDQVDKSLRGKIKNPKPKGNSDTTYQPGPFSSPVDYPEAVIAFSAEFYSLPTRSPSYFKSGSGSKFDEYYSKTKNPIFTRNMAVRR